MNNTKTIFKSLLIMIVAISLFTVSCSKDEGGTKTPTQPPAGGTDTTKTEITADIITAAFTGLNTITIGKMDFNFASFNGSQKEMTGTASSRDETSSFNAEGIKGKFSALTINGATVAASAANTDNFAVDKNSQITIAITITPANGNSFAAETDLQPYTKGGDGKVTVTLKLSPESGKKWDGTAISGSGGSSR